MVNDETMTLTWNWQERSRNTFHAVVTGTSRVVEIGLQSIWDIRDPQEEARNFPTLLYLVNNLLITVIQSRTWIIYSSPLLYQSKEVHFWTYSTPKVQQQTGPTAWTSNAFQIVTPSSWRRTFRFVDVDVDSRRIEFFERCAPLTATLEL